MSDLSALTSDQLAEKVRDLENREWAASCTPSRYGEGFEDALKEAMPILREAMRRASESEGHWAAMAARERERREVVEAERDQAVRERDECADSFREVEAAAMRYRERADRLAAALERAAFVAEHLHAMIDRETWRANGAEWMGQYEGDHHAERVDDEIKDWAALAASEETQT